MWEYAFEPEVMKPVLNGHPESIEGNIFRLIIFSFVMMVGSYGAGSAPLFMPLNEEKLHMISVLGAGLCVLGRISIPLPSLVCLR